MKIKTLFIAAFCGLVLNAQTQSYDFSATSGNYSDLEGSTSINNGLTWDDPEFVIPIGFDFQYFDTIVNIIYIDGYGYGGDLTTGTDDEGILPILIAYGADIADRGYDVLNVEGQEGSLSPLSYKLEGNEGNRILKIEWKNVGFYGDLDDDNISTDFTNFQLWLYEGSNNLEIHFGPNSITQTNLVFDFETGTYVGLFPEYDFYDGIALAPGLELSGNPSSPNANYVNQVYGNFIDGVIPNGTVYRFTNTSTGTSDIQDDLVQISISPNPSSKFINVNFDSNEMSINTVSILNTNGQIVKNINYTPEAIDISALAAGVYFVHVNTNVGMTIKRLVKN